MQSIISSVTQILVQAGFLAPGICVTLTGGAYKDEYIALVTLKEIRHTETGFHFLSGSRERHYEYKLECRLLGKQGDCSDRDTLLAKAEAAREALITSGFEVTLANDNKIDGKLSRAVCTLNVTKGEIKHIGE